MQPIEYYLNRAKELEAGSSSYRLNFEAASMQLTKEEWNQHREELRKHDMATIEAIVAKRAKAE